MFFGVDENFVSEMATSQVDEVPQACKRMPSGYASSITDIGVVEGEEGIEQKPPPRMATQAPCEWHEEMTGEGDEDN